MVPDSQDDGLSVCARPQEEASSFLLVCGLGMSERQCGPKRSYDT